MTREEAIKIIESNCSCSGSKLREACAMFIPELAESEDERVRKEIIDFLTYGIWSEVAIEKVKQTQGYAKWIAYLEKQKINTEGDFARGYDCGYECCLNSHGAEWLEKQKPDIELIQRSWYMEGYHDREFNMEPKWLIKTGEGGPRYYENPNYGKPLERKEQKSAEKLSKEEYVKRFKALCNAYEIKLPNREYDIYHLCDDLSKLFMDSDKQKPAEWSEEDFEKLVGDLVQDIVANEKDAANYGDKKKPTSFFVDKYADKFRKMQPKVEWSEEDEMIATSIVNVLKRFEHLGATDMKIEWLQNKLKSLRPKPHWKPSEEQMSDYKVGDKISWKGRVYTIDKVVCYDNLFEIIDRAKQDLLDKTNIADSPEEMAALYNFLFRCWQMGWLKKYETQ